MPMIELTSTDGHQFSAYRAEPAQAPRGGIVVIQEIFGVNSHIRAVTDGFAQAGYLAIAPAVFDRVERGVELGYDQDAMKHGVSLVGRLDYSQVFLDLHAAASAAGAGGKVGMVGYCFGGTVAWLAAARMTSIAAAVSYYGSTIVKYEDQRPAAPLMMHVGIHDASFPIANVREIGARYPELIIHEYDAGHGFNCDQRGAWNAAAAAQALERTLTFFGQHLA